MKNPLSYTTPTNLMFFGLIINFRCKNFKVAFRFVFDVIDEFHCLNDSPTISFIVRELVKV